METPLIVTLKLDEEAQEFFNALRREHFPRHINYLEAHCTLFHKLPAEEPSVLTTLAKQAKRPPLKMAVTGVSNIGNGVIYNISSGELQNMQRDLQIRFAPWLINQDRQTLKPHVTVQNKVTVFKAGELYNKLRQSFEPFGITGIGFSTWLYLKGPWQHVEDFIFQEEP